MNICSESTAERYNVDDRDKSKSRTRAEAVLQDDKQKRVVYYLVYWNSGYGYRRTVDDFVHADFITSK